jgi:hypothetical protein
MCLCAYVVKNAKNEKFPSKSHRKVKKSSFEAKKKFFPLISVISGISEKKSIAQNRYYLNYIDFYLQM